MSADGNEEWGSQHYRGQGSSTSVDEDEKDEDENEDADEKLKKYYRPQS